MHNLKELINFIENSPDEFVTFYFGEDELPATVNLKKLREQTPAILARYRIASDRSESLR